MNRSLMLAKRLLAVVFIAFLAIGCSKNKTNKNGSNANAETNDGFCVISYEPEGTLPVEVKNPSIFVQFSEPVVPLSKLGEPSDKSDIISIEPELKGVFRWYGTSLLSFECSDEVIPQTEYIVTINNSVKSINGNALSGMNSFSFKTEELKMVSVVPGYGANKKVLAENPKAIIPYIDNDDVPVAAAGDIAVFFSYPVDLDVIKSSIEVCDESGKIYSPGFSKIADENGILLSIKDKMPENQLISVTMKSGAQAQKNSLKTSSEQTESFHTILPFSFRNADLNSGSYGKYTNPIYFYFSHQIDEKNIDFLVKNIKTSPSMNITKDNIEIGGSRLVIYGLPVSYEDIYSVSIPAGISDIYGRKTAESVDVEVEVPAALSLASFKDYGSGILEAQFAPKLAFQFQNILPGSYYEVSAKDKEPISKIYQSEDIPKNKRVIETVDLEPLLDKNDGLSVGNIYFEAGMEVKSNWSDDTYTQSNTQIIQVTDLGATVRYGYNKAVVLVTSLKTGEPISGAQVGAFAADSYNSRSKRPFYDMLNKVSLFRKDISGNPYENLGTAVTDQNGYAVIDFKEGAFRKALRKSTASFFIEVVNNKDRLIFRPDICSMWRYNTVNESSPAYAEDEKMYVFMFTDRKLYKPAEKITFRGIDRTQKLGKLEPFVGDYTIEIKEDVWKGETIKTFSGKTTASGGFYHSFTLPSDLEPGDYLIKYSRKLPNGDVVSKNEYFQIAFFERLRFQASASIANINYTRGDRIDAAVAAEYLGGGSLAGCKYESTWFREPCGFSLKGGKFDGFTFGPLQGYDSRSYLGGEEGTLSVTGKGSTSVASGGESLKGMAYQYRSEIRVTDQSNQMIAASASTVVHPALYYIGLSSPANATGFAKKGDKLDFKYQAVMPDGSEVSADALPKNKDKRSVNVELLREEWNLVQQMGVYGTVNTRYVREMVSDQTLKVPLDKTGSFSITPKKGGSYLLRISSTDKNGNDVVTERRFYVIGSDWYYYGNGNQSDELTLTCDKDSYAVGETAKIMLQSPLEKGRYLLTIEREGIFHEEILNITDSVTVLDIPVKPEYLPIAYVTLSTYSTRTGEPAEDFDTPDMNKPKGYFGLAAVHVNTDSVTFDVSVKGDKSSYRPGETAKFTLKATKNGVPVSGAELSFMAVDRGVIDLINYHVPNPVEYFYNEYHFPVCTQGGDSRSNLIDPVVYSANSLFGGDAEQDDSEKMNERKNFEPTAVFEPYLVTGEDGTVECTFVWPDNLTAYRVTTVGVNDDRFAISESEVNVSNPVSARDVVPSTLRFGDISEAGLIISNLQDTPQTLEIEAAIFDGIEKSGQPVEVDGIERASGHASLIKDAKQSVTVPANSTSLVMFPLKAEQTGFVTVQFVVRSQILNEKILKPIEIERPYVFETVTTTGSTGTDKNASAKELLIIPGDADNNQGNLTITLDATRLGVLKEAVDYVFHYPYGCLEQRSSAIMPMVYFADYIKVLGLESEVKKPRKVVEAELKKWKNYQHKDGSFPYWPSDARASFPVSVRIGEIAAAAKDKDYDVVINTDKLGNYIFSEYNRIVQNGYKSLYMKAYVNYVLARLGHATTTSISEIVEDKNATITELCYAGLTYAERGEMDKAKDVLKKVAGFMRPTTRGIDITNTAGWSYWQFFGGEIETYALALKLYSAVDPENANVGRLVWQLLQLQKASNGYWKSTATTARVLDAFATYIEALGLEDTNFTAEALIDGKKYVSGKFKSLGAEPVEKACGFAEAPVKDLPKDKELPVEFSKNGPGDLFYTVSMKYAVSADRQVPRDEGLGVYCEIIDLASGKVVTQDKLESGKTYKAHVVVSTTRDRTFVALRVPVPAGAEIQNAAFVTTGSFQEYEEPKEKNDDWWWDDYYTRLSNETIYENEVQYFWNYMSRGRQEVDFLFRAVRSGTYQTPAVTAECMYEPEIFGRSGGKVWIIE
ncbi:MAG: MG2 domain-containing protein [Treponemataceae bacterium]|nr:MG2 domain-containing protein [Treponemataceae bacterium]